MFVKIKLEPNSSKALSPLKNISYFPIDDDASVLTMKLKIEKYVDVPADNQEIRSLNCIFENNWKISEVCDVTRGSSLMLYSYDDFSDLEQFICFLQVYENELALNEQDMNRRSYTTHLTPTSSISSSVTLIAVSDSEKGDTSSDSGSSKSSEESDSSSSSGCDSDRSGKKRSKHSEKPAKKPRSISGLEISSTLCKYLNEFPNFQPAATESKSKEIADKDLIKRSPNVNETAPCTNSQKADQSANDKILEKSEDSISKNKPIITSEIKISKENDKLQSNITSTNSPNLMHPLYEINPEIRQHVVIICNPGRNITSLEYKDLLMWFFEKFRLSEKSANLEFDKNTSITLFEGKIYIACIDENTQTWINDNLIDYRVNPYATTPLNKEQQLVEVVIPMVSKSKNILDVFHLLEKQNLNLYTLKWCVKSRSPLSNDAKEFTDKAVSQFCTNEILHISMNQESIEYLQKQNFRLKYCFWHIVFELVKN